MTEHPDNTAQAIVANAPDLPTLPDIYFRIREILQDRASTHQDVADALATDPAIAARLLKLANSAFYGRPNSIDSISRAVGLLGTQQVHDLVLATATIKSLGAIEAKGFDLHRFWYGSVLAGSAAKLLAEHCDILDSERLFVAGLIAQIGQLLLYRAQPQACRDIERDAATQGRRTAELQRERLGFDYAAVSAELFAQWQLPEALVEPIRLHTHPADAGDDLVEAGILHIAVQTTAADRAGKGLDVMLPLLDDAAWRATELTRDALLRIQTEAVALTEGISPLLLDSAA